MLGLSSRFPNDDQARRLTETWREMLARGEDAESLLSFLRQEGCRKVASIRILMAVLGLTLPEAKDLVHNSVTWSDIYDRDQAFHDTLENAVRLWQREENWRAELERVFDVVSLDESTDAEILRAAYWEGDESLELTIDCGRRTADIEYRRKDATERFRVAPLDELRARTAGRPYRLDLHKLHGGGLTLWFKPLGCSVGGSL
jgi:hypothetical protein